MTAMHIVVAMKPIEGNYAGNAIELGVVGLNVDGCRVGTDDKWAPSTHGASDSIGTFKTNVRVVEQNPAGRWPANVIHDGSDEVKAGFPETTSGALNQASVKAENNIYGKHDGYSDPKIYQPDSGSAARFFKECKV